jgi:hypothetical protein
MSFANKSPWNALPVPLLDAQGRDVVVAIVKATFHVDPSGAVTLSDEQRPIRMVDVPRTPDDPSSSLVYASDVCVEKRGTDVVIVGDAVAPRPTARADVAAWIRDRYLPLVVHGLRTFYDQVVRVGIGPAQPFERWPLAYEYAAGGASADLSVVDARNPSGVGVARRSADLVGTRAPQIEHAEPRNASIGPAGFGPIGTHWSPRRELAGTFDAAWQATRMPLLPLDYDIGHANFANPLLVLEPHVTAGDSVRVLGMSIDPFVCALPALPVVVRGRYDTDERVVVRPLVDTLVIEPEARVLELVARAALLAGRNRRILRELVVEADG